MRMLTAWLLLMTGACTPENAVRATAAGPLATFDAAALGMDDVPARAAERVRTDRCTLAWDGEGDEGVWFNPFTWGH